MRIRVIIVLLLLVGLTLVYLDYNKEKKKVQIYCEHDLARDWMKGGVKHYKWEYDRYPDNYRQVLALYDSINKRQYPTARDFFTDIFSSEYLKIIKVKDKSEYIGALILSAGYGGEFVNKISEIDISDKNKLKLYKNKEGSARLYLGGFKDYLFRNKDLFVAYYNYRFEELANVGRQAKDAKKMMDRTAKIKGAIGYYSVHIRAVVKSIDVEKNELLVVSDSVEFYCHHIEDLSSLKVNDTINISGLSNELQYPEYHLDRCMLWDFELTRENVRPYLDRYWQEF